MPDDDLVTALAEHLAALDDWVVYNVGEGDVTQAELCQALVKKALAVVAEQLPTREDVIRIMASEWERFETHPRWAILLPAQRAKAMADALLRDLRGRLGVKL